MSKFDTIDIKLNQLANRLNARVTKDRPGYPDILRTFDERRIDWADHLVNKAIIIQPTFEETGVDSSRWNLVNIAWHDDLETGQRLIWQTKLADKTTLEHIITDIDNLLQESEGNLNNISKNDLV